MMLLLMMAEEAAEEAGWSKKNKNPTWQCGEQQITCRQKTEGHAWSSQDLQVVPGVLRLLSPQVELLFFLFPLF